ncbi:HD domain-containing phosphohydrolase [Thalassotalea castellviae]|uniref:HD domain-containing phosphohydrolase n=1 Tax=Thalassotalea castellviae TaxID=3075612 RepID=A0ABU2ZXY4_9GAMM|nr:HD domain-containing phosphohydrolase [Thalassotalea sp. W431]MDT0602493.1 HD domain-containing phosphohydrolase [Thalassotalea sp. W431]
MKKNNQYQSAHEQLVDICVQLNGEKDTHLLLEKILLAALDVSNADAGTIYLVNGNESLEFQTVINHTLGLHLGGSSNNPVNFSGIPLMVDGKPNTAAIVVNAVTSGKVINIDDVYDTLPFDFSAARKMDKETGYRTQSMLTFPLKDHANEIVGVIQLINAQNEHGIVPFSKEIEHQCLSFASVGAIALTNKSLVENLEELFQSFIQTLARVIDEKSPHTGEHCKRVPELTLMFAKAVHEETEGPLASVSFSDNEMYQLGIAGWLHDCGKVATPDHVIDKSTKLQAIFDRIEYVLAKLEIVSRDIDIKYQQQVINALKAGKTDELAALEQAQATEQEQLNRDRNFLQTVNIGGEFLHDEDEERILTLAKRYHLSINGETQPLLNEDESYNLRIKRGTLNTEERLVIQRHMDVTLDILEGLPFPKHMQNVAEYALGHHETMDGKGYPRGLTKEQLSVPARIMALADIFEALSSADRPYKKAKQVSECLTIMGNMVKRNCLDPDLFDIFVHSKVYESYINKFSSPEQIDDFDLADIPGLTRLK